MDILNVPGSVISHREIRMQGINSLEDERRSVWVKETRVVSSTPIHARSVRRGYVVPSRRPSSLRYSVTGSPGVSPVRRSTSFTRDSPSPLREIPDQPVTVLNPRSCTQTHVPNNISRHTTKHEACVQAIRDTQRNVSKWVPKHYASQRTEQYMPLEVLSDDGEGAVNNYAADVRMNGCRRKRVTISKPTFQQRSSNKGFPSKCDSVDSGKGTSEAISSGIRTVNDGSVGNEDHESSLDSGHDQGKDVYVHQNSIKPHASDQPMQRISGLKTIQPSKSSRDSAQEMWKHTVSQLITSVNWKSGPNADYDPLEVVSADEDSGAVINKKNRGAKPVKGRVRKGIMNNMETYHCDNKNNADGTGQCGILKKPNRGRPLKNIVINSNVNDFADERTVERVEVDDEIQSVSGERFNPEIDIGLYRSTNISRKIDYLQNCRSRDISPSDSMSDTSTHSHRLRNDVKEKAQRVWSDDNHSPEVDDCGDFTDDEIVTDESLCSDNELGRGGLRNHLINEEALRKGFGRIGNGSQHYGGHIILQNASLDDEIDENDFEIDDERSLNTSGPIKRNRNSHRKLGTSLDISSESCDEQDDEYIANTSRPIHGGSYRHGDHCLSPSFKTNAKANKFVSREGNCIKGMVMSQCSQTESFEERCIQNVSGNYDKASVRKPKKAVMGKQRTPVISPGGEDHKGSNAKKKPSPRLSHPNKGTAKCTPKNSNVVKNSRKLRKSPAESSEDACGQEASKIKTPASGRRPKKTAARVGVKRKRGRRRASPSVENLKKGNDNSAKVDDGNVKKTRQRKAQTKSPENASDREVSGNAVVKMKTPASVQRPKKTVARVSVERKRGRRRASPSVENLKKGNDNSAKVDDGNVKKTRQRKAQTKSPENASDREVSGKAVVKQQRRGRRQKSSSNEGQGCSSSLKNDADNKKRQKQKRKKNSDENETDENIPPKRRTLLNPVGTNNELSLNHNGGNLMPLNVTQKKDISKFSIAKRNSQVGSSGDYLRKKVLTMRLGTSVFQRSVIENNEKVATSTPKKPVSDRMSSPIPNNRSEITPEKPVSDHRSSPIPNNGSEAAQVTEGSEGQNNNEASVNNSPVNILNRSLRRNEVRSENISKTGSKPDNSISEQNSASKHEKNHSKANESINKLDTGKSKSLNTSLAALPVNEKVLDLPSKNNSANDTQSTVIGKSNLPSSRRGSMKVVIDGKEKELALLAEYSRLAFHSRHEGTKHQDDKVRYGAALDVLGLGTGYIHLAPGSEKGLQHPKMYNMVFLVLDGTLGVKIHETDLLIRSGDFFAVPKGCKYNLIGRGDKNAVVAYFKCKAL